MIFRAYYLALLGVLILSGLSLRILGSEPSLDIWPCGRYYERLGNPAEDVDTHVIYIPAGLISQVSKVLSGPSSDWNVVHESSFSTFQAKTFLERSSDIVQISDRLGHALIYLIKPDRWIRLNDLKALKNINYVINDNIEPMETLRDFDWAKYINRLAFIYPGGIKRAVLSKSFLDRGDINVLLKGKEKDPKNLTIFFRDPEIITQNPILVSCYLITSQGSIEKWNIDCKFRGTISISNIKIEQIKPPGTFSYGETN